MSNKVFYAFIGLEFLFICTGVMVLAVSLIFKKDVREQDPSDEATCLLLRNTPLNGAVANSVIIFVTALTSIPAMIMPKNTSFLKFHSWLVLFCALFTLVIGLDIWFSTLKTRSSLGDMWAMRTRDERSILQQQFNCCGYFDANSPPFVTDKVCTSPATAARLGGCIGPFSSFANNLLDIVFTALFGVAAVDGILFLATVVLIKDRAQNERYRLIDAKSGFGAI